MSSLTFHRCKICGAIFYHAGKNTYCAKCVPSFSDPTGSVRLLNYLVDNPDVVEARKAKERARWRKRMSDPAFREHERRRSLMRARAERKYAKEAQ